jgi:hypothetical protein
MEILSLRWDSDEPLDELAAFADRVRVRGRGRLAGFPAEWQERAKRRVAEITASGRLEPDLALPDENQAADQRPQPHSGGPVASSVDAPDDSGG